MKTKSNILRFKAKPKKVYIEATDKLRRAMAHCESRGVSFGAFVINKFNKKAKPCKLN